ncbi:probable DNA-directed primase/polymerase protein at C-terminar half [Coccomyxa sp. Obi]|nr:probable DNA-directed primase/polymerase protein at C-terminar half [Coccomyxa sp. Obi]
MPGVKRPADSVLPALAVAGRKGSQTPLNDGASLKASEQTPKQKAASFAQRPVIFVDLTVDDPEQPAGHDSIGAVWDASPMSVGRSPTEKVSTPGSSSIGDHVIGSPMAISPQTSDVSSPAVKQASPRQGWQPTASRFQAGGPDAREMGLPSQGDQACSGSDSEVEAEQMREGSQGECQRPSSAAAAAAPATEQPDGLADAHRVAAETYRAALAALNDRPAAQNAAPPQAPPILSSKQWAPAAGGLTDRQPFSRQPPPQQLRPARQHSSADGSAVGHRQTTALGGGADAGLAAAGSASHAAALQEYKDALRLVAGLPPEVPAPSLNPQSSSRGAGPKAKSGYTDGIYCTFPRQQQAIECADQHNCDFQLQKQNQQGTSGIGLPGGAGGHLQQRAVLSTQTAAAMEEGRVASAVARTAKTSAGTCLVPANTQQLACMEEGLPPAAEGGTATPDRCQQPSASSSGSEDCSADIVKVFCEEAKGRETYYRRFVAASYDALWARFAKLPPCGRHFYEVVREGRPCHMYFDLEYIPACNPLVDGEIMVTILLNLVRMGLRELWGLQLEDEWVWELDSSCPDKWSRHIIVVVPGRAFPNNLALGAFVNQILSLPQAAQLRVEKTDGRRPGERHFTSLVDVAVYTKNRHFRTALSCKGAKGLVLKSTGRFAASQGTQLTERELFMRTLVCNVGPGALPLACGAAEQLLRVRLGPGVRRAAQLTSSAEGLQVLQTAAAAVKACWKRDAQDEGQPLLAPIEELQRWGQQIVAFIEDVARERSGGAPATVRTIAHCGTAGLIAYSMLGPGSHYCENIGRCHASNHVFFVVSLSEGQYAQKCYDPDCAHFRSAWMPLPPHLLLSRDLTAP